MGFTLKRTKTKEGRGYPRPLFFSSGLFDQTAAVIYRSGHNWKTKRNFEIFSTTDFIAAAVEHIPDHYHHTIRYYGVYFQSIPRHRTTAKPSITVLPLRPSRVGPARPTIRAQHRHPPLAFIEPSYRRAAWVLVLGDARFISSNDQENAAAPQSRGNPIHSSRLPRKRADTGCLRRQSWSASEHTYELAAAHAKRRIVECPFCEPGLRRGSGS